MYFNKIHHPANFHFCSAADLAAQALIAGKDRFPFEVTDVGGDVFRLSVHHARWTDHGSHAELASSVSGDSRHTVRLAADGSLSIHASDRKTPLLQGRAGETFGLSGQAWLFRFAHHPGTQYYGLGEHNRGLEKSGQRAKFWNTDLFGDFDHDVIRHGHPNPMYVAIPWLIVKTGNHYVGLLVHNPGAVFMDLASDFIWSQPKGERPAEKSIYVGAPDGRPEVYIIVGPSLAELTRKFQTLVGTTARPPLWALGHHQCRWGYAGPADLKSLDQKFTEHGIPCDGLWLDIDYMDGYRVFTFAPKHWGNKARIKKELAALAANGRRVVPILDPGVKVESGYDVCDDGLKDRVFCLNAEGQPFVGYVWPGQTHFPDFSEPAAREWWAARVKAFAELGVAGAWLDMNDPSVGAVELDDMRFARGTKPHAYYHNQYALGMAKASHAGFLAARPDTRPFLLSRSAFISSARYTAVWCGDNCSNWHHLRMSIPVTLGLALSGVPFNGADVAGFHDDTNPELAIAWYKAAFLFPFFRNHTVQKTRPQEPWALGRPALAIIARYIRLRYKLLPYLYQLFIAQESTGEAILRPLFHDFDDTTDLPLGTLADQFLVGPAILQAPIVVENARSREVTLPGKGRWFSAADGRWLAGGAVHRVSPPAAGTPLFFREGSLVPMQSGERRSQANDLGDIELHCLFRPDTDAHTTYRYHHDDGESHGYRRGEETVVEFAVHVERRTLVIQVTAPRSGYRPIRLRCVHYAKFAAIRLILPDGTRELTTERTAFRFSGKPLHASISAPITLAAR